MSFDIETIKRKMLVKYPFFGSIVANVDYKLNTNIPTTETDGKVVYYNLNFLEKLNIDEQIFIFTHEICHIAFNHILRSEGKDSVIWNIAADAVINAFLKRDGLKLIKGVVDMEDAINYDVEQLYEKLLQEKKQDKLQENKNDSFSESGDSYLQAEKQNVGHDTHSMWESAVKKHKEEQAGKNKKENLLDKIFKKYKHEKPQQQSGIEKKQEEIEQLGEKDAFKKNREVKKKELEELKKELSQQAMAPGSSTNEDIINITDIGRAKYLIDWRYVLRDAIKYEADWSYKNATIEEGVISANLEAQPMPETEIVLDTSGSISETLLKNFLRECMNILRYSKIKVGCFDTKFYGFQDIRTEEDIEKMQFKGAGGTNFDVAVGAFSRRVENKIIFTDGNADMPDIPFDAIWIVLGDKKINPKGGKVIQIDTEQLDRLYSYQQDSSSKGKSR